MPPVKKPFVAEIVKDSKSLLREVISTCGDFPQKLKFILSERLYELAMDGLLLAQNTARLGDKRAAEQHPHLKMLDWVIVGGESGPHARPMHPSWARGIRDQCVTADVPFHFKQWGEWLPVQQATADNEDARGLIAWVRKDGTVHDGSNGVDFFHGDKQIVRVGKKAAGRLLDGHTWDEFPKVVA